MHIEYFLFYLKHINWAGFKSRHLILGKIKKTIHFHKTKTGI